MLANERAFTGVLLPVWYSVLGVVWPPITSACDTTTGRSWWPFRLGYSTKASPLTVKVLPSAPGTPSPVQPDVGSVPSGVMTSPSCMWSGITLITP